MSLSGVRFDLPGSDPVGCVWGIRTPPDVCVADVKSQGYGALTTR